MDAIVDPCHVDQRPVDPCLVDHCATRRTKKIRRWPGFPGARPREAIGAGFFVFRRGDRTGRIENRGIPFEHPTLDAAVREAKRLRAANGGEYEVVGSFAKLGSLARPTGLSVAGPDSDIALDDDVFDNRASLSETLTDIAAGLAISAFLATSTVYLLVFAA